MTDLLRDPLSAQLRRLGQPIDRPQVVCGEVNARNGFGGYVGFMPFWYNDATGDGAIVEGRRGADDFTAVLRYLPLEFTGCAQLLGVERPES